MKTIAIFVIAAICFAQAASIHDHPDELSKYEEECSKESEVSMDIIERAEKGEFGDEEELKCFPECFFKKAGWMNEKGEINEEALHAAAAEKDGAETRKKIVDECLKHKGSSPCETAKEIYKCYWTEVHKHGI